VPHLGAPEIPEASPEIPEATPEKHNQRMPVSLPSPKPIK